MDRNYLLAIVPVMVFGSMGLVVRQSTLDGLQVTFFASLVAGLLFAAVLARENKLGAFLGKPGKKVLLFLGIAGVVNNVSYFYAYNLTTISNAVFSHYLAPALVLVFAPLVIGEKVEKKAWLSLVVALAGLGVLLGGNVSASGDDLLGITLGVVSAFGYAFGVLLPKRAAGYEPKELILAQMGLTALILLPFIAASPPEIKSHDVVPLLALGIVYQGLSVLLFFKALKLLPAQKVSLITYLEPVAATVFAAVLLHETPSLTTLAGGAMILLSCYLAVRK